MKKPRTIEDVIAEALRLREEGVSPEEIFSRFSEQRDELRGIFSTINLLEANGRTVPDGYDILRRALHTSAPVTKAQDMRYSEGRGDSGRPSIAGNKTSLAHIMNAWKVFVPLGVVALLLVVFISAGTGSREMSLSLRDEADQASMDGFDSSFDIESAAKAIDDALNTASGEAAKTAGTASSINFIELEKEINTEAKSVELGNDFEAFFAEEEALGSEVNNAPAF